MAITARQIQQAKIKQDNAAHDLNGKVRLVAGPGTGKSFVIEERVVWLIQNQNISPNKIIVVSFTRASANNLKDRIYSKGVSVGINNIYEVRVSTLHSLALFILRKSGNLAQYPTDPTILDDWEISTIFDREFSKSLGVTPTRASEIRRDHEAFWNTGTWNPANLPVFNLPITQQDRSLFNGYYTTRTQTYACVLPGEVVRTCVNAILMGHIDPITELGVEHLIIDEVQDLNPCDFEFIDALVQHGINVFISGDDDQSIYSFRYAFPQGIQDFTKRYPTATDHVLNDCFRCTVNVLNVASNVLNKFSAPNRISKNLISLYSASIPVNNGVVLGNRFNHPNHEVEYIANSCQALIASGISPKDIMILVGNKRALLSSITSALQDLNLPFDANLRESFKDSNEGRFLLSILRIITDTNDYIAHRVVLGTPRGVGLGTAISIANKVISNNLNFRGLFYSPLPNQVFVARELAAIYKVITNINSVDTWGLNDTINARAADIDQLLIANFTQNEVNNWRDYIAGLPPEMTLEELKKYLQTDSELTKSSILNNIYHRTQEANLAQVNNNPLDKIKVLSFHSSKGLSSKVVFIPGLEEDIFPTQRSQQSPGLILENARLFYVAITRAEASCIMSYSSQRIIHGQYTKMTVSRFAQSTEIVFNVPQLNQLSPANIVNINKVINDL